MPLRTRGRGYKYRHVYPNPHRHSAPKLHLWVLFGLLMGLASFGIGGCKTTNSSNTPATNTAVHIEPTQQRTKAMIDPSSGDTTSSVTSTAPGHEVAVLAGGCFWGVEDLLRALPGVVQTEVGYTGGHVSSPTYSDVKTGRSGHAESVRVVFDPARLSYERLLLYFFKIHDPTTKNRQGND